MPPSNDSRRNTPAANADLLGEDASFEAPPGATADDEPARSAAATGERAGLRREPGGSVESGEARPGRDINQAGFVKDPAEGQS